MSQELLKAIVAGAVSIISAVIAIIVKNYLDKKKEDDQYRDVDKAIQEAVEGRWKGEINQTLNGNILFLEVIATFKVSNSGSIKGQMIIPYENESFRLKCVGGFYSMRFIKMEYENHNKAILQFGSMVFKLSDDCNKFEGYFVGYGHISKNLIAGSMVFTKD